jgi:hypothetical protein
MTYQMMARPCERWAVKWNGAFHFDGAFSSEFGSRPLLFNTRAKARKYIENKWGYIRTREDLRRPPHSWRMPIAVRVEVSFREPFMEKRCPS